MPDFDQIEQVLRRYDFRCDTGPNETEQRNLKAWRLSWVDRAIAVLEDAGYHVAEHQTALLSMPPVQQVHYFVEIGGRTIYPDASYATLLGFAHDLCNDYRDRDMAALVEYVKERREIDLTILSSHGVAGAMAGEKLRDDILDWTESNLNDWRNLENDFDSEQKESTPMCDCGERLESLSERVGRIESAAKCKDRESVISGYDKCGGPIWVIDPNGTQVSTGTGNVTISPDGFRVMSSGTTFQASDNMQWHTSTGTGKVLIERDDIVAEIERRRTTWMLQSDESHMRGDMKRSKQYRAIAKALQCLADDIASGAYDNE